jgi:hypothetical protein
MKSFLDTTIYNNLHKPIKFYKDPANFNEICELLRNAVKLKPNSIINNDIIGTNESKDGNISNISNKKIDKSKIKCKRRNMLKIELDF